MTHTSVLDRTAKFGATAAVALQTNASPPTTATEKNRRLQIVAAAYASEANVMKIFLAIALIENMTDAERQATSTTGTLMQPAVDALNEAGVPTASTLGALEVNLGIDGDEVHDLACACHGLQMYGSYMSETFAAYQTDT